MHPAAWLVVAILALLAGYGLVCAYRLTRATVADAVLLIILAGAAMGAGYLFGNRWRMP